MKKSVLVFSLVMMLIISGMNFAIGQEQPQPKKDTVNMDTQAKPEFYYAVEDEETKTGKGAFPVIPFVAGVVVVGAVAAFLLLRKKK
jgi:LPXTG-motif cell wall-anchored protein